MTEENIWKTFFDGHAPEYMENVFTKNTPAEVDFVIKELNLQPGAKILDMGCGTCRHSVELARRGYAMTGVDLSEGMLAQARKAAAEAGVTLDLIQADATTVKLEPVFDGAICLCEGAFGLIETGDDPTRNGAAILANLFGALKPGGKLVLTVLNGIRKFRQYSQDDVDKGVFDPLSVTEVFEMSVPGPDGERKCVLHEKGYTPSELTLLTRQAGFEILYLGGGTAGDWGKRPPKLDEMELMMIAVKP